MKNIKSFGLLILVISSFVQAELGKGGATGTICAGDGCVWYLNVKNELTEPIKVQGYLLERVNVPFLVDIWYPYTFTDVPALTELAPNTDLRVASLQDRSRDQRYWQFYTYHLNVMRGAEKHGFTVKLGWPQRSNSHTLTVSVRKHKWHQVPYPMDQKSLEFTVIKDEESAKTFDAKAYGIAEMEKQFAIDQKTKFDQDTALANPNCVVTRKVKTRLEHILKTDTSKTLMTPEDYAALKRDNPSTYEQHTIPVYVKDVEFIISCSGMLTHDKKSIDAELTNGLVYTPDVSEGKVRAECPQDPHANTYAEKP